MALLTGPGVRFRATALYAELEVLRELRPRAKAALLTEDRRNPAWRLLRTIPFFGPVRVALLLATMQTPWRFRRSGISGRMWGSPWSAGPVPTISSCGGARCDAGVPR